MSNSIKKRECKFVQVSNSFLRDERISFKAKGLFCYMFSMADGWNFTIKSIATQQKDGQASIISAMKELKKYGFISYTKHQNGKGTYFLDDEPNVENPNVENPNVENPNLRKPSPIKNNKLDKNINHKNIIDKKAKTGTIKSAKLDELNSPNCNSEIHQPILYNTETTPETTSDIDIKKNKQKKDTPTNENLTELYVNHNLKNDIEDFVQHRKDIKKPFSKLALTKFINLVDKYLNMGLNVTEMIDNSIVSNYSTIYAPKQNKAVQSNYGANGNIPQGYIINPKEKAMSDNIDRVAKLRREWGKQNEQ